MTIAHKNFKSIFGDIFSNSFFENLNPLKLDGISQWIFSDKLNCDYLTSDGLEFQDHSGSDATRKPQPGRCYNFDGTDDFVDIAHNSALNSANNFSVSLWVNDTKPSGNGAYISKYLPAGGRSWAILDDTGSLSLFLSENGSSNYNLRYTSIRNTGLKHLVFTFNSGTIKLYVNGVEQTPNSTSGTAVSALNQNTANLNIGRLQGAASYSAKGDIFDVRIFNRTITADEVSDIYNFKTILSGLIAWYKCDEASGSTCYDSSGNSRTGTITNATLSSFHATNVNIGYSFQNEAGYTYSSGVYIPRNENNTTQDAAGNSLQYSGRVKYPLKLVQSACGNFDGADDYLSVTSLTGSETVVSKMGTATVTIAAGQINFSAGTCYNLVLNNGSKYTFSEGGGATIYDVSGNNRHGSLINTTEGSFWGQTQDEYHYNITNGFRLSGSTRIPALESHSNAADGNPITHFAGNWHNNAGTKLQQYDSPAMRKADSGNFWFNGSTVNAKSNSDLIEATGNKIFCNTRNSNKKRNLMSFVSSLSNSNSHKITKYVRS